MQAAPETGKPVAGKATSFQKIDVLAGKIEELEDKPDCLHLQAVRLRNRFAVSWPVARVVASLAYGEAH